MVVTVNDFLECLYDEKPACVISYSIRNRQAMEDHYQKNDSQYPRPDPVT